MPQCTSGARRFTWAWRSLRRRFRACVMSLAIAPGALGQSDSDAAIVPAARRRLRSALRRTLEPDPAPTLVAGRAVVRVVVVAGCGIPLRAHRPLLLFVRR